MSHYVFIELKKSEEFVRVCKLFTINSNLNICCYTVLWHRSILTIILTIKHFSNKLKGCEVILCSYNFNKNSI